MSEILDDTVRRLFAEHAGQSGERQDTGLWGRLAELGLTAVGLDETLGGSGGTTAEAAVIVRAAARHAVAEPIGETLLVATALGVRTGPPEARWTVAVPTVDLPRLDTASQRTTVSGRLERVAWGRSADNVAMLAREDAGDVVVVSVPASSVTVERQDVNLAGEPRDALLLQEVAVSEDQVRRGRGLARRAFAAAATARSVQMSAALDGLLEQTVEFANTREQFGRSLGRFQAVQQMVAELAAEVAAARSAADGAVAGLAFLDGENGWRVAAAAKVRTGRAATTGARIAHQVHGAIGFTQEHALHRLSTRLWSWREEYGAERYWSELLGAAVLADGGAALWPSLATDRR